VRNSSRLRHTESGPGRPRRAGRRGWPRSAGSCRGSAGGGPRRRAAGARASRSWSSPVVRYPFSPIEVCPSVRNDDTSETTPGVSTA
jgi:hypothetical protein